MQLDFWIKVEAILMRALELPPEARSGFLDEACETELDVREEVESLLEMERDVGSFLESPAAVDAGFPDATPSWLRESLGVAGRRVGAYQIQKPLGIGGMGAVYLAKRADEAFEKQVAIKLLRVETDDDEFARRFLTERQILAVLEHPNIARLVDGGTTEDGRPYLVMEHVDGLPLDDFCERQGLDVHDRVKLILQVCDAVAFAHRKLVVHRDLKPQNILVTESGMVKLLDFGIAKLLDPAALPSSRETTRTGLCPMSPHFASPEQIRGQAVTTASDVYSLGVVLYELLTGTLPRQFGDLSLASVAQELARPPSAPSAVEGARMRVGLLPRQLAGDLDAIVLKALREEPESRYTSVADLAADLRRSLDGRPVGARRGAFGYRTGRFIRAHRIGITITMAVATVMVASAVALGVQAKRIAVERDRAQRVAEFTAEILREASPVSGSGTDSIREVLDRSARRIDAEFADQPAYQADLLLAIGRVYNELGMHRQAEPLLRRSVDLRQRLGGLLAGKLPYSLSELGCALDALGQANDAYRVYDQALTFGRDQCGQYSDVVVITLQRIGEYHWRRSEYDQAVDWYRKAHEAGQECFGPDHPVVAKGLSDLAYVLCEMGEFEESERLHHRAVETFESVGDADPAGFARALNGRGVLYWRKGRLDDAAREIERALELREALFDIGDPIIASTLEDLANVQADRGELKVAEDLLRRCLQVQARGIDADDPGTVATRHNLASVLYELGLLEEARQEWFKTLELQRRIDPDDNFGTAAMLRYLASTDHYLGLDDESGRFGRASLEMLERLFDESHPEVRCGRSVSARLLAGAGNLQEAEAILRDVLASSHIDDPWWRWQVANRSRLSEILIATGRLSEARTQLDRARELLERNRPSQESPGVSQQTARLGVTRGDLLYRLGDAEMAAREWERSLRLLVETPNDGSASNRLLQTAVLLRLNRPSDVRAVAEDLIALRWERPSWLRAARQSTTRPEEIPVILF